MNSIKIFLFTSLLLFCSILFSSEYYLPDKAASVYSNDLDLDGDYDIIVGHFTAWSNTNTTVSIFNNDGSGYFTLADTSLSFCGYQYSIFAKKIDADNYLDIVAFSADFTSGEPVRYLRVIYNDNGVFENYSDFPLVTEETADSKHFGDIDGDNDNDIVLMFNIGVGSFWGIMLNDGNGSFSEPEYYPLDFFPHAIKCGNLNSDNRADVVICGGVGTIINYSTESGFVTQTFDEFLNKIEIIDFDNDGDNDIVGFWDVGYSYGTIVKFFENIDNESFIQIESYHFTPGALSSYNITNLNNDSLPDILCVSDDTLYTFVNKGNFQIERLNKFHLNVNELNGNKSFCTDFDGDGYDDVVIVPYSTSPTSNNMQVLFNDTNGGFVENPVSINDNYELAITNYELKQCYPNPFNPVTKISCQLAVSSNQLAEIVVYNAIGQEVWSQILTTDHSSQFTGYCTFDGSKYNSGIYYYSLIVDGKKLDTKSMLLIK